MTGPVLLGLPTIAGKKMALADHAMKRHVSIIGAHDPLSKRGGGAGSPTYTVNTYLATYFNGPEMYVPATTGAGSFVEFDVGLIETSAVYDCTVVLYRSTARAIVRISCEGVAFATDFDCYSTTPGAFTWSTTWTPPANVGRKRKIVRVEAISKNASSSNYHMGVILIAMDRQPVANSIAL